MFACSPTVHYSVSSKILTPSPLERYLADPNSTIQPIELEAKVPLTTEENYSIRMGQLINSYFTIMNGLYTIIGGLNNQTSYLGAENDSFMLQENLHTNDSFSWYHLPQDLNMTGLSGKVWAAEGTKSISTEVIIAHVPWVIPLCIASSILVLASLVSPLVHFFLIRGPEVMMNISSLAPRHNPYIPLPSGRTYLDASARARLLKEVEVRFGDIEKGSNIGHLVVGALQASDEHDIVRIKKRRLYE